MGGLNSFLLPGVRIGSTPGVAGPDVNSFLTCLPVIAATVRRTAALRCS